MRSPEGRKPLPNGSLADSKSQFQGSEAQPRLVHHGCHVFFGKAVQPLKISPTLTVYFLHRPSTFSAIHVSMLQKDRVRVTEQAGERASSRSHNIHHGGERLD